MERLEFDEVWEFVRNYVLPADTGDSVLVPDTTEWDQVKSISCQKALNEKEQSIGATLACWRSCRNQLRI